MAIFRSMIGLLAVTALWLGMHPGAEISGFGTIKSASAAELASETRALPPFNRIEARGSFEIQVAVGGEQSVLIEAEERDFKRLKTEVRNETLVLSYKERWFSFLFDNERIVTISLPALLGMEFAGSADINVTGIDSEAFDMTVSGSADVILAGSCGALDLNLNGAGEVSARELLCETVTAVLNGAADAELYASKSIEATVNGVGNIEVYGNPEKVSKQINGFGDFEIVE